MSERIEVGSKVELLPGRDEVYERAVAGSRGIIRHAKLDKHGYPMVYVEWDKDHWKYNGEPDGWTFESHFKVISPPNPNEEVKAAQTQTMVQKAQQRRDAERCPTCGGDHEQGLINLDRFISTLSAAFEKASEGQGFVLITVNVDRDSEIVTYRPVMYSAVLHDDVVSVLEGQIASLAIASFKDYIEDKLKDGDVSGR